MPPLSDYTPDQLASRIIHGHVAAVSPDDRHSLMEVVEEMLNRINAKDVVQKRLDGISTGSHRYQCGIMYSTTLPADGTPVPTGSSFLKRMVPLLDSTSSIGEMLEYVRAVLGIPGIQFFSDKDDATLYRCSYFTGKDNKPLTEASIPAGAFRVNVYFTILRVEHRATNAQQELARVRGTLCVKPEKDASGTQPVTPH